MGFNHTIAYWNLYKVATMSTRYSKSLFILPFSSLSRRNTQNINILNNKYFSNELRHIEKFPPLKFLKYNFLKKFMKAEWRKISQLMVFIVFFYYIIVKSWTCENSLVLSMEIKLDLLPLKEFERASNHLKIIEMYFARKQSSNFF